MFNPKPTPDEIIREYQKVEELVKTTDRFTQFFDSYFKGKPHEDTYLRYKTNFLMLSVQLFAIRLDLGNEIFKMKCESLPFTKRDATTDVFKTDTDASPELTDFKNALHVRTPRVKYLFKSFFIFNKMFYDLIAQIIVLAYFENGPKIGKAWKQGGRWSEQHHLSSYNDLFYVDKDREKKECCPLRKLDPEFFDKMNELNIRYKNEIRAVREDFVHNFSDINFKFEPSTDTFQYQIVAFEKVNAASFEEKGPLFQLGSIDNIVVLTQEVVKTVMENFKKE